MRAAVEGSAAHQWRRLARHSNRQKHLAIARALSYRVIAVIRAVEVIVGAHMQPMGTLEDLVPPRTKNAAFAIEYHNGMVPARKEKDGVLAVYGNRGDIPQLDLWRELRPVLDDFEVENTVREARQFTMPWDVVPRRSAW